MINSGQILIKNVQKLSDLPAFPDILCTSLFEAFTGILISILHRVKNILAIKLAFKAKDDLR